MLHDDLITHGHHFIAESLPATEDYLKACDRINMFDLLLDYEHQSTAARYPLTPWLFVNALNCLGPVLSEQLLEPVISSRTVSVSHSDQRLGALATGLLYPARGNSSTVFAASGGTVTCPCQDDFSTLVRQTRGLDDQTRKPTYAFTAVPWAVGVHHPEDGELGSDIRFTIIDPTSWALSGHLFIPIKDTEAWHTRPTRSYPWEVHSPAYRHVSHHLTTSEAPDPRHPRDVDQHRNDDPPINYN